MRSCLCTWSPEAEDPAPHHPHPGLLWPWIQAASPCWEWQQSREGSAISQGDALKQLPRDEGRDGDTSARSPLAPSGWSHPALQRLPQLRARARSQGSNTARKKSCPTRWGESSPHKARELPGGASPCSVPCPAPAQPHTEGTSSQESTCLLRGAELPFLPPQASPVCTGFLSRLEGSSSPIQLSSAGELKTNGLICAKSRLQLQHLFLLFSFFLIFHTAPDKNEYNYCY